MGLYDRASQDAPVDLAKLASEMHNAMTALRDAIESNSEDTLRNVQKKFDEYERLVVQPMAVQRTVDRKRLEAMQLAMATGAPINPATGDIDFARAGFMRDNPEYKSFMGWLTNNKAHEFETKQWDLKEVSTKALRTDSESAGGYLVPQILDATIKKNILEISPIRRHARVRIAHSKSMDLPRRLAVPIAAYEGETEPGRSDQSTYGSEQVTCYRQQVTIPVTLDMLVSSAFDLEQEIALDVGESMAQGEGLNFVKGSGRKGPQGLTSDDRVVPFPTADTGKVTWSDFAAITGELKRGYRPEFYLNRRSLAAAQALTSTLGLPIWQPAAGPTPALIWGYPYDSNVIDLDNIADGSGAKPVLFGDLYRAYEILDMIGMHVVRDDLTAADQAITKWTFRRYNTGRVVLPEALKVMVIK